MYIKRVMATLAAACVAPMVLVIVTADPVGNDKWLALPTLIKGKSGYRNLWFRFRIGSDSVVNLNLHQNDQMDDLPHLYSITNEKMTRFGSSQNGSVNGVTVHQDRAARAAIMVTRLHSSNSTGHYSLTGTFEHGCGSYFIEPLKLTTIPELIATIRDYAILSEKIVHRVQRAAINELQHLSLRRRPKPSQICRRSSWWFEGSHSATACAARRVSRRLVSGRDSSHAGRRTRQIGKKMNYIVEMAYVVDHIAFQIFPLGLKDDVHRNETLVMNDLRYYFWHVANTVDLMLSLVEYPRWTLRARLTRILVLKTPFFGNLTGCCDDEVTATDRPEADYSTVLSKFREWYLARTDSIPEDHLALFTGHNWYVRENGQTDLISGIAYSNGVCNDHRVVAVRLTGGFHEALLHLHELGHNLGAQHDGEGDSQDCPAETGYVMQPFSITVDRQRRRNPVTFSSCSLRKIDAYFRHLNSRPRPEKCLSRINFLMPRLELGSKDGVSPPGQVYTADDQCQQVRGSHWRACPSRKASLSLCYDLQCYHTLRTTTPSCSQAASGVRAAEGTSCGDNRWCTMGDCVYSASAPRIGRAIDCVNGEWRGFLLNEENHTCITMPRSWCYNYVVRDVCCETCPKYSNATDADCEFGDHDDECRHLPLTRCASSSQRSRCCKRCKDVPTVEPACRGPDVSRSCAFSAERGLCYTDLKLCCESCTALYDAAAPPDCAYGDWHHAVCRDPTIARCRQDNGTCCRTCAAVLALSTSETLYASPNMTELVATAMPETPPAATLSTSETLDASPNMTELVATAMPETPPAATLSTSETLYASPNMTELVATAMPETPPAATLSTSETLYASPNITELVATAMPETPPAANSLAETLPAATSTQVTSLTSTTGATSTAVRSRASATEVTAADSTWLIERLQLQLPPLLLHVGFAVAVAALAGEC